MEEEKKRKKSLKQKQMKRAIMEICDNKQKTNKKKYIIILIKEYLIITMGAIIMAIGTALFLLPNELSTGGFSGISTIIYYLFGIPLGTIILMLNIPLFIVAYFRVGKDLFFKSIYGTICLSSFINIFERATPLTHDNFLSCIYGGILMGIGTAIILKLNGSTGGSDLLSYIIRTYKPQYRSANLILIIDFIIITLNVFFLSNIEIGLYSAIAIYLMGKMIDIIFEGANFAKVLLIISPKYQEIAEAISQNINRGSTGIYSKGMYTNQERLTLLCVGSRTEAYTMEATARKIDKSAFIIIINAREVLGKGFK